MFDNNSVRSSFNLNKLTDRRKAFLWGNADKDHVIVDNPNSKVVLSAPHGVSQIRLGRHKSREIGSIATALYLQEQIGCSLIAKTKSNNDDANFDEKSSYKRDLAKLIKKNNIRFLIDIHGLSRKREMDVNIGIHLGHHITSNEKYFDGLYKLLLKNAFSVTIDAPFMAGGNTISNSMKKEFDNLFALQLEINSRISNIRANFAQYSLLLKVLVDWIKSMEKCG